MNVRRATVAGLAALTLAGCSGISTSSDWDTSYDFSGRNTYAWMQQDAEPGMDNVNERRMYAMADEVLAASGFQVASPAQADYLVAYHVGTQSRQQYDTYGYGAGGWWGGYWGGGMTTTTIREYEEGTLILDFIDRKRNELVWRGSASKTLDPGASPQDREETLRKAFTKMLADFPPES
jgi:hypothetical protein